MKIFASAVLALLPVLAIPTAALADEFYTGIFIGSQHIGNDKLNNVNPGLTIGHRWDRAGSSVEYHIEAGVFYNSYKEVSPILMAGISTRLAEIGPGDLRVGASIGTAYYEKLSHQIKREYGIPNVGGFIPIVALSASYRIGGTEVRLTTVPPDVDTKAVVNLSLALSF